IPFSLFKIHENDNGASLLTAFAAANSICRSPESKEAVIYFLEDDYLHLPRGIHDIYHGAKCFGLVTGYDHYDRYRTTDDVTNKCECIAFNEETHSHWRSAESTTCTWAVTSEMWKVLGETAYAFGLDDRGFFRALFKRKGIR